jgi:integrase/recombinase XerD
VALRHFPPAKRKKRTLRHKPRMPVRAVARDPSQDNPLHAYRRAFLEWALAAGYADHTGATRDRAIARFIAWCDERALAQPQEITRAVLERYQRHLWLYRKADGQPLSLTTQESLLNPLRAFCKWLAREHHILYNPASELVLPRSPRQLPKALLSVADVEHVLGPRTSPRPKARQRQIVDISSLQDQLHAQLEQPVLESIPVAMRLVVEVVDTISAQLGSMAGADIAEFHDTGDVDLHHDPVVVDRGQAHPVGSHAQRSRPHP